MRIIISSLLLILALHFLLQGINYKKIINICKLRNINKHENKFKENFETIPDENNNIKLELLKSIQCKEDSVVASNKYIDDKNDSNFQSDVMNINKFYKKNVNNTLDYPIQKKTIESKEKVNLFTEISQYSNQPDIWNYKNELVMNGGELLNGITGYDNLIDQYSTYGKTERQISLLDGCSTKDSCVPSDNVSIINDDLRMGLGIINNEVRGTN